ncbi:TetR/AcrR family transcriptional regulator C-terminal domain-containing protein [Salinibacterium sp. NSLL150]|uniref:TetR/AcrR family transcriptional regulator C-terminal domain-containing protein n=1 Tax=unclassified Salinibacterium TaxID=2632331 RepID=UPI0018CF733D|nr:MULTISPECIES: TetR/AcrR family transcriptional regulator C-terminal domain-containing protein [unclassified Salinibacterium]MBH0097982.1 TetR/AcrR family transcriptional regulator C-terminal domain-containing protein [Salinibacterium sp. NSLL35]MBH0100737.1 TetR/AcrR family transcriptional regulator C-terminal domain-containing protein [Salinibacterium sp. NSLL150]MBH0103496.1 TetR/AcrR family transcriptional regulator C-terminal domain-containing protein [Salinibacterium sp. NSLL16]MBH01062
MASTKRPTLTRKSITATALALADTVGLNELTTRRLAVELGVKSPALYWHFANKQALLDGMGDAIILSAGMGAPLPDEGWQKWVERRARAYRTEMLSHRDGARIVASVRTASPETVRLFGDEIAALAALGFDPALAVRTIAVVSHYVTGFVLKEQAAAEAQRMGVGGAVNPMEILDGPALDTFVVAMRTGGDPLGEDVFEHGLRMIILGTERELAAVSSD